MIGSWAVPNAHLVPVCCSEHGGMAMSHHNACAARYSGILNALHRRYGFEALVYNEYHGATGFFFTPYAQKRIPGAKLPSIEVDGDTILGTFGFETENIRNNVIVLCVLLLAYLTITLLLLIFKRH